MTDSAVRQQISREVKRALVDARLSARGAAAKMGLRDGKLIYRWMRGEVTAPLERLEEFALAVDQPLTLNIGPDATKDPPPQWARDLTADIRKDLRANRETIVADLARRTTLAALEDNEPLLSQIRDVLARVERRLAE